MAKRLDMTALPKTLGAPAEDDDGTDLVGNELDDENLAGDPDELDDEEGEGEEEEEGEEEYSFAPDLASLRQQLDTQAQQIARLTGGGTGGDGDGDVDLSDLPDPVTKPQEFKAALAGKINGATKAAQANAVSTLSQEQLRTKVQGIETSFKSTYPKLAKKTALLAAATQQELQAIRNRGLDPQTVMFGEPEKFIKKVARRMEAELGIKVDDTTATGRHQQRVEGRTKGVSRGSQGGADGGNKKQQPKKPVGFVNQILQNQQKMGLI